MCLLERLVAERVDAEHRARRIEDTHHDFFAEERRARADAEVDGPVLRDLHLDAAVLGHAPLGDVEPGHDLQAGGQLDGQLDRRGGHFLQHAVEPEPDPVRALVGFEVDVRCATLDRIEHDLVDEPDDGRVFDVGPLDALVDGVLVGRDLEAVELEIVAGKFRHRRVDLLQRPREQLVELVLLDDDRLDRQARGELDLVDRVEVGRIGDREEQPLAALHQRQHAVLADDLLADQPQDLEIGLQRVEVEQRGAELQRRGNGDLAGVGQVVLDEVRDDADAPLACHGDRIQHRGVADQAVRDQALGQALQATPRCSYVCGNLIHQWALLPGRTGSIPRNPYRTGPGEEMLNPGGLSPGWRAEGRDPRHRTRCAGSRKEEPPHGAGARFEHPGQAARGCCRALAAAGREVLAGDRRGSRRAAGGVRAPTTRIVGRAALPDHVAIDAGARREADRLRSAELVALASLPYVISMPPSVTSML